MAEPSLIYGLLGTVFGVVGTAVVQLIRTGGETDGKKMETKAKLEEHWTDTTLELVDALRSELSDARRELGELRPLITRLAHFEESLDHLHALLAAHRSGNAVEIQAAERRASAFLSRMRGDAAKGEMRQAVQTVISAQRIVEDVKGADAAAAGGSSRGVEGTTRAKRGGSR